MLTVSEIHRGRLVILLFYVNRNTKSLVSTRLAASSSVTANPNRLLDASTRLRLQSTVADPIPFYPVTQDVQFNACILCCSVKQHHTGGGGGGAAIGGVSAY